MKIIELKILNLRIKDKYRFIFILFSIFADYLTLISASATSLALPRIYLTKELSWIREADIICYQNAPEC